MARNAGLKQTVLLLKKHGAGQFVLEQ